MKNSLLIVICIALTGCATTEAWKHSEGGEALTVKKTADAALIKTKWGEITLKPEQLNGPGLWVDLTIKNTSDTPIVVKLESFKAESETGEIVDAMTEPQIQSKFAESSAMSSMMVGGMGYAGTNAVTASVANKVSETLFKEGKLPPKSTKKGFILFSAEKSKGNLKFRIDSELTGVEQVVKFTNGRKSYDN